MTNLSLKGLVFLFIMDFLVMELGEGMAGEAASPGLAVQHQGQVMLLLGG